MLSNALFILGVAGGALVLLDFYLGENQKKRLQNVIENLWIWLDDLKRLSLLDFLKDQLVQKWIARAAAVVTFVISVLYISTTIPDPFLLATAVLLLLLSVWLAPRLMAFVLSGTILQFLTRSFAVVFVFSIVVAGVFGGITASYGNTWEGLGVMLLAAVFFMFLAVVIVFTVLAPVGFVAVASIILHTVELTVLRMSQYSKGPILAISFLCGAAAVLLKSFNG